MEQNYSCFVIGPIGDKDGEPESDPRLIFENSIEVFEEVIEPACRAFGIQPIRADQISDVGEIPEQVFLHLRDDDVVIADLTGANANVMYELGLRHSTGNLTIQLGERGQLPFDISAIRTILFKRSAGGLVEARKQLTATLSAGLEGRFAHSAATRVFREGTIGISEPRGVETSPDDSGPGFLEKIASLEAGVVDLAPSLQRMNAILRGIGEVVGEASDSVEAAPTAGERVRRANVAAARLHPLAASLEESVASFRASVEKVDPGTRYLLSRIRSDGDIEGGEVFQEAVREAVKSVGRTISGAERLAANMRGAGEATRDLRKVNGRLARAIDDYVSLASKVKRWEEL